MLDAVKSRINRTRRYLEREGDPCVMCGTTDPVYAGLCKAACVWCVTATRMTTSGTGGCRRSLGNEAFNKGADPRWPTKSLENWVNMCPNTLQSRG